MRRNIISTALASLAMLVFSFELPAQVPPSCSTLPNHDRLRSALQSVIKEGQNGNGGLGNQEWAAIVDFVSEVSDGTETSSRRSKVTLFSGTAPKA